MEVFQFYTTEVWSYMNGNPEIPFGSSDQTNGASSHNMFTLIFLIQEVTRTTSISNTNGRVPRIPREYVEHLDFTEEKTVPIHKDHLLSENGVYIMEDNLPTNMRSPLSLILSSLSVPIDFQDGCINKIYNAARSAVQSQFYFNQHIVMEVNITYVKHYVGRPETQNIETIEIHFHEDIDDDFLMGSNLEDDQDHYQPESVGTTCRATESSIEALEKVSINTTELMNDVCAICLNNLGSGMEVQKLPCSHAYHRDCIKQWLSRSIFCPLCRFSMPCAHHHVHANL